MRHVGTRLALTCSLVLLSACSERVSFLAPKFQMGSNNVQALVVTPDGEVHESGKLTVSIRGFLDTLAKKRRLLATLADVEKVVVEVSASGLSFSQTIEKADINSGTTSATFTGIPEGAATVTMKAYNLANQLIGQASKATSVTAGNTTTVEIQLQLDPTYTQPSTGGGSSTGSITANGTIIDGPVIEGTPPPPSGTVIGTYQLDHYPAAIDLDTDGNVWVANDTGVQYQLLSKFSSDGSLIAHYDGNAYFVVSDLDIAADGSMWVGGAGAAYRFSSQGQLLASASTGDVLQVAASADGGAWLLYPGEIGPSLEKLYADGSSTPESVPIYDFSQPPSGIPTGIAMDSQDNLWAAGWGFANMDPVTGSYTSIDTLTKFSPDGNQLAVYSLPYDSQPMRVTVDSTDHMWVTLPNTQAIAKVSPAGALVGTYSVGVTPRDIAVDTAGNAWVTSDAPTILKLAPTGETIGTFTLPHAADDLAVGSSSVWVSSFSNRKLTRLAL